MRFHLRIWRQVDASTPGALVDYDIDDVSNHTSFLEVLDLLNERLAQDGERVIAFDHDCREGICGQCGVFINGRPHGPGRGTTTCQLHMRSFKDGETLVIEPWRARAFPVVSDLVVDRTSLDRIVHAGGFISTGTGAAPEANAVHVAPETAEAAFDAAACIGCGACVATCKNASAMLFVGAKVAHLATLPQGRLERTQRALDMVHQMDAEGFGGCTFTGACEAECPKHISVDHIARLQHEWLRARLIRWLG